MVRLHIAGKGELDLGAKGKRGQLNQLPRPWAGRSKEAGRSGESSVLLALGYRLPICHLTQSLDLFCNMGIFSCFAYSYPILQMRD